MVESRVAFPTNPPTLAAPKTVPLDALDAIEPWSMPTNPPTTLAVGALMSPLELHPTTLAPADTTPARPPTSPVVEETFTEECVLIMTPRLTLPTAPPIVCGVPAP